MRKLGFVIFTILFLSFSIMGCNRKETVTNQISPIVQPGNSSTNNSIAQKPEKTDIDYSSIGSELINKESIGFFIIGTADETVIKELGKAEEKSDAVEWGADGKEHQTWKYISIGVYLDMIRDKDNQYVNMITVKSPCNYKTSRNIRIGSSKKEVIEAYKNGINKEDSLGDPTKIVVGSIYGGIIFNFENDIVSSIFVGAAAE